jgi:hypothetical protein
MKNFLLVFLFATTAWAQNAPLTVEGTLFPGQAHLRNFVKNPGAEMNVNYLTVSSAIVTRSTTTPLQGKAHFSIDATATAQTVKFDTWTLDNLLKGQLCEAKFVFTGDASLYKAYVEQGSTKVTSDLALTNETNSSPVSINFSCGDLSSNSHLVIESTGNGAAISVDEVYLGKATNSGQVSQAIFYGGMTLPGGEAGCTFSENGSSGLTNFADLGTGSGCSAWTVSGAATAQATNDHRIVFNNMPAGDYLFQISGSPEVNTSGLCSWRISDGTNVSEGFLSAASTYAFLSFRMSYTSAGNRTFKIQAADNQASGCAWSAATSYPKIGWSVYKFPSSSQQVLTQNTTPAYWQGYHDSTCAWTRTNTAYGAFTADASCAVVQQQASNISCVATGSVTPCALLYLPKSGAIQYLFLSKCFCGHNGRGGDSAHRWHNAFFVGGA